MATQDADNRIETELGLFYLSRLISRKVKAKVKVEIA